MNKQLIKLTEQDLHAIVKESVKRIITESYKGTLYHYTTLPLLYSILHQNNLIADLSDTFCDYRKGTCNSNDKLNNSLCFTRDKMYDIRNGLGVACRLVFDAEKLMQIRGARLYPVNFSRKPKFNKPNEAEERLWGVNVYPLDKYIERIDIIVSNLSEYSDGNCELDDKLWRKYSYDYFDKYPNAEDEDFLAFCGKKLINSILRMKKFKGKINVIYQ